MVTTLKSVHQILSDMLRLAGVDSPKHQAAQLVSGLLRRPLTDLYRYPDVPLDQEQTDSLINAARKHAQGVPIVYLTGQTLFFNRSFIVHPGVLIPRADSEVLVEAALSCLLKNCFSVGGEAGRCRAVSVNGKKDSSVLLSGDSDTAHTSIPFEKILLETRPGNQKADRKIRILDICSGSGCIGISIAAELRDKGYNNVSLTLTDIDETALNCAAENIKLHQLTQQAVLLKADLFPEAKQSFDLITANPPYIPSGDIHKLSPEVHLHEPHQALDGGEDGLLFYRRLITQMRPYLRRGGLFLLEHGWNQADDVMRLLQQQACFSHLHICTDYGGHERVSGGYLKDLA